MESVNPYTAPATSQEGARAVAFQFVWSSLGYRLDRILSVSIISSIFIYFRYRMVPEDGLYWSAFFVLFPTRIPEWWREVALRKRLRSHPLVLSGRALYGGVGSLIRPGREEQGKYVLLSADSIIFEILTPLLEKGTFRELPIREIQSVERSKWFFNLPGGRLDLKTASGVYRFVNPSCKRWAQLIQERMEA